MDFESRNSGFWRFWKSKLWILKILKVEILDFEDFESRNSGFWK
jgi:hypothetical protein